MGATTIGNAVTVTTGVSIGTLPITDPISIISNGAYSDSYWTYTNGKLTPNTTTWTVGLGTVNAAALSGNYFLIYDATVNEVKKIASTAVPGFIDIANLLITPSFTGGVTSAGYYDVFGTHGTGGFNVTSSGAANAVWLVTGSYNNIKYGGIQLSAAGPQVRIYAGANYAAVDSNGIWYNGTLVSLVGHTHTGVYEPALVNPSVDGYVLTSTHAGFRSWVPMTGGGGGGGTTTNALIVNSSGTGDASGFTFNGSATKTLSYNSIGAAPISNPTFTGTITGTLSGNATSTTNINIIDDNSTASNMYPVWVTNNTGTLPAKTSSTKIKFNPSTATLYCAGDIVAYSS